MHFGTVVQVYKSPLDEGYTFSVMESHCVMSNVFGLFRQNKD